jgi:hypothetical protein
VSETLIDIVGREIGRFLEPIVRVADDPTLLDQLMASVGIPTADAARDELVESLTAIATLESQIDALLEKSSLSISDVASMLEVSRQAFEALRGLDNVLESPAAFAGLGQDLADRLITNYLFNWHPLLRSITALLGIQELAENIEPTAPIIREGELVRGSFAVDSFHFDRLGRLLRDPAVALRDEYGNSLATSADADAMADKLFPRLQRVLGELGLSCRYGFDPDDRPLLGDAAPFVDHALIIYADDMLAGAPAEAGIILTISAADRGDLGLVFSPFGTLTTTRQAGAWVIEISLTADVDVLAYGRHGLTLLASPASSEVQASLSATLAAPEDGPPFMLGAPSGSRLEVGGAQLKVETSLSEAEQSLALSADVSKSAIVIAAGDGDSFLSSVLPAEGLRADFDLGLAWSNERGLTLRGSAGLDATIPIGRSIAGLELTTLYLSLQAQDSQIVTEVSASARLSIGPVDAVVERIGIAAALSFPETGGNLGVADLDFHFKPPTGLGLAIDASVVSGGGFVKFDPDKGEYAGILDLRIVDTIAVKAIGLLITRMPDGGKGYSLMVIITAEGFAPIQLGYGFKLTGIGGLVAINRTFDEEALRSGLKNHALESVLFPQDPIRNAPQILSNLNKFFPPVNHHYLFGPMVQIGWPTPTLITANLAIVLEFGARLRLLILAQILAILPKPEEDLVHLQMDAIGVLDFDQGTAALDATLHDSRLAEKFVLTGDMAMRLNWEGTPNFALAVGGLYPAFNPPVNFPKLERVAINFATGDNPRFRCESYFALTANTVQFGARAELYAAASEFSIQGETGFDVLIQLDPFHFLADFYAQLQLKRGSTSLFKVRVEGALDGPRPLHIKAKATFEILLMEGSIHFDKTLVEGEKPPPPEPIDVLPRLKEALTNPGNWTGKLPDGQRPMVTLRGKPGAATDVLLHPLGTLTIKQSVVPLNMDISKFGQAAPAGERRFTISVSLGSNGQNQTTQPVEDFFAPAQFLEISDDEKLSRPSFEPMTAGISIGSGEFVFTNDATNWLEVKAIEFETWIVDKDSKVPRPSTPVNSENPEDPQNLYKLNPQLLRKQARFGAAGTSDLRRTGRAKYRTTSVAHTFAKEGWSIVVTDDLTVQSVPGIEAGKSTSYSEAKQALRKMKQEDPTKVSRLTILRLSEVEVTD